MATVVGLLALQLCLAPRVWAQDLRTGVEQLASEIAKAAPEGRQLRVAVVDFPDLQNVTSDFGRYISSRLTTRLAQSPNFFVIERQRLAQVLAELKFSMSDLVDPAKAKQLGRMAGVEAIVVGTVADLGNQVDIDARLIEIETNRTVFGATITISRDPTVAAMLERGRVAVTPSSSEGTPPAVAAAAIPAPPKELRGLRFSHKEFTFEVSAVEIVGDEIKLTLVYVNNLETPARAFFVEDINSTYLIDNLGHRYKYSGDSFGRRGTFAPKVPERIWITFGKYRPAAQSLNLVMKWYPTSGLPVPVVIRGIPLPQ